jgi:predicted nuclease of predicted toxin-antitoxin system
MRVLLDENLPHALKRLLPGHTVGTVQEQGWAGIENGKLLAVAEPLFYLL